MFSSQNQHENPEKSDKEKDDHKVREQVETVTPDSENQDPESDGEDNQE